MSHSLEESVAAQRYSWSESFEKEFEAIGQRFSSTAPDVQTNLSRAGTEISPGEFKTDGNPFSTTLKRDAHELDSTDGIQNDALPHRNKLGQQSRFMSVRKDSSSHSLGFALLGSKVMPTKNIATSESATVVETQTRSQAVPLTLQQIAGIKQPAWTLPNNSNVPSGLYPQIMQNGRARDRFSPLAIESLRSESASVSGNPFLQQGEMPHLLNSQQRRDEHRNKLVTRSPLKSSMDPLKTSSNHSNVLRETSFAPVSNRLTEFRQLLESKGKPNMNNTTSIRLTNESQPSASRDHAVKIFGDYPLTGKTSSFSPNIGSFIPAMEEQKSIRDLRSHIHTLTLENQKLQHNLENSLRMEQQNAVIIAKHEVNISRLQSEIDPLKQEIQVKDSLIERLEREINMWKDASQNYSGGRTFNRAETNMLQNHLVQSSSFDDNKNVSELRLVRTKAEDFYGTEKQFETNTLGKVVGTEKLPDALSEVLKILRVAQQRERSCADLLESRETALSQKEQENLPRKKTTSKKKPFGDDFFTTVFQDSQVDPFKNAVDSSFDDAAFETTIDPFLTESAAMVEEKDPFELLEKNSINDPFQGKSRDTSPVGEISFIKTLNSKDPAFSADSDTFPENASPVNIDWSGQTAALFAKIKMNFGMDLHKVQDVALDQTIDSIEISNEKKILLDNSHISSKGQISYKDENILSEFEPATIPDADEKIKNATVFTEKFIADTHSDAQSPSSKVVKIDDVQSKHIANPEEEYFKSSKETNIEDAVGGKSTESTSVYVTGEESSEGLNVESPNSQLFGEDFAQRSKHEQYTEQKSIEETLQEEPDSLGVRIFGVQQRISDQDSEMAV